TAAPSSTTSSVAAAPTSSTSTAASGTTAVPSGTTSATAAAPSSTTSSVALSIRHAAPTLDGIPREILTRILRLSDVKDRLKLRTCNRSLNSKVAETDLYCDGLLISQKFGAFR
ncbi:hypothetical protein PFISCL1PPCAC_2943, partial [Pristionchus fissidentatus]